MKRTVFQSLFIAVLLLSAVLLPVLTSLAQPQAGGFPISRVSLADNEDEGDRDAGYAALTAAGRYVAFHSYATNLIANDTNGTVDVFVRDTEQETTTRVSVSTTGEEGNDYSYQPDISGNGRFTVFTSAATNFAATDNNNFQDVFLFDGSNNSLTLVSESMNGGTANSASERAHITGDGEFVVFTSLATNILPSDTNEVWDCYIRNNANGTFNRILTSTGAELNNHCIYVDIATGTPLIAFGSDADNVVPTDTNGVSDIFTVSIFNTQMTRVSVDAAGNEANGPSFYPSIARDGAFVAFESSATNLVSNDTNGRSDIFVHNAQSGGIRRVSVSSTGEQGNGSSTQAHISDNGQYVVFTSVASNLVPNDTNGFKDIFIHDMQTGITERLSTDNNGNESNADSSYPVLSGNGEHVAFESDASNLVPNDTNEENDVFKVTIGDFPPSPTFTPTASPTLIPSATSTGTIIPVTATPTVSPSPTINVTEFPATPSATGTPPTATPTLDPTKFPPTATPTGTIVPTSTGSPMPTVTGTPPTATPTLDPTEFPPTVTPTSTTVPPRHYLYLPLTQR